MDFNSSIVGQLNTRMWSSPMVGASITAGMLAGVAAGVGSYASTDGSAGTRADAGASSALKWGAIGTGVIGGGLIAANLTGSFRAGWDGYKGPGAGAYGTARNLKDLSQSTARNAGSAAQSYSQKLVSELRTEGGWKKTLARPAVSGSLGAMIGAGVGHHLTGDAQGTVAGAAIGAGAGVAIGRAITANQVWSKWGAGRKVGAIAAGSVVLGLGAAALQAPQYENVDTATSDDHGYDSGVADRMKRMNVDGNIVFGLHHKKKQRVGLR